MKMKMKNIWFNWAGILLHSIFVNVHMCVNLYGSSSKSFVVTVKQQYFKHLILKINVKNIYNLSEVRKPNDLCWLENACQQSCFYVKPFWIHWKQSCTLTVGHWKWWSMTKMWLPYVSLRLTNICQRIIFFLN